MNCDINISLSFDFDTEDAERISEAQRDELIKLGSTLFEMVHYLAFMHETQQLEKIPFLNFIYTSSQLGGAVVEAIQINHLKINNPEVKDEK